MKMIHEQRAIQETIAFLNELLVIDEPALRAICFQRVPCNRDLAEHPTVQVNTRQEDGSLGVGLLGVLNGLFGADAAGWGPITAVVEADGRISSFKPTMSAAGARHPDETVPSDRSEVRCCFIDPSAPARCTRRAEYEIFERGSGKPESACNTHACDDHLLAMLTDAPEHLLIRLWPRHVQEDHATSADAGGEDMVGPLAAAPEVA